LVAGDKRRVHRLFTTEKAHEETNKNVVNENKTCPEKQNTAEEEYSDKQVSKQKLL